MFMKNATNNRIFTALIFFLSILGEVNAQCSLGNFILTTQQQVDDFGITYAHCTAITLGDLTIEGNDITNLDGLSNVTEITGGLTLWNNPQLTDINGLSSLTHVGGALDIRYNASLAHLNALSGLTGIVV